MLALGVALPVLATDFEHVYPSYQGCQVHQLGLVDDNYLYAYTYDENTCATRVAAKGFYFVYGVGTLNTGWTIHADYAEVIRTGLPTFTFGYSWSQIETGTNDWGVDPGGYGAISQTSVLYP